MGQLCWRATLGVLFSVNMSCLLLSPFYGDGLTVPDTLALPLLWACGAFHGSGYHCGIDRIRTTEYEAVRGNGWSTGWSIRSRRCHVNLQKQSTPWLITRWEWSNPSRRHGVAAAPLQAARRQQQSNAVVSQLHTMNLRLTREEGVALLQWPQNFVGNQFSIIHRNVNRLLLASIKAGWCRYTANVGPPRIDRTLTLMKTLEILGVDWVHPWYWQ
jgi:hypothetical protein